MGDHVAGADPGMTGTKPHILGKSDWARKIRKKIARIAPRRSTVLITGPTGTGKELIARCLHTEGSRREGPFVPVDCAAISGSLCASQLFGHVRGAFTGADYAALGCFRAADGGTIFLDEVGELEPAIQSMLLRVIQARKVVPVGSHEETPVDVRIVAATNRNLEKETALGRFREDLFYRLNVVSLKPQPLKQRQEDIPSLAEHFLSEFAEADGIPPKRLSLDAVAKLCTHTWPGNVRELQNVLEQAAVFADEDVVGADLICFGNVRSLKESASPTPVADLPGGVGTPAESAGNAPRADDEAANWTSLAEQEAQHIGRTLELTGYNQSEAARLLKVDRNLLARKMRKYGICKPADAF